MPRSGRPEAFDYRDVRIRRAAWPKNEEEVAGERAPSTAITTAATTSAVPTAT